MDCPKKYPLHEHCHHTTRHTEIATPDQALDTTGKTKKEETSPDHSLNTANIVVPAIRTCTEAASDHNNVTGTATIEAAQGNSIQHTEDTVTGPPVTHHTGHTTNPPHTTAHQATALWIVVDHTHDHLTNHQNIVHTKKVMHLGIILKPEELKVPSKEEYER